MCRLLLLVNGNFWPIGSGRVSTSSSSTSHRFVLGRSSLPVDRLDRQPERVLDVLVFRRRRPFAAGTGVFAACGTKSTNERNSFLIAMEQVPQHRLISITWIIYEAFHFDLDKV